MATMRKAKKQVHSMFFKRLRACTCDAAAYEEAVCICDSDPPARRFSPDR